MGTQRPSQRWCMQVHVYPGTWPQTPNGVLRLATTYPRRYPCLPPNGIDQRCKRIWPRVRALATDSLNSITNVPCNPILTPAGV
eukprot:1068510-Rhodomonas_salina.1